MTLVAPDPFAAPLDERTWLGHAVRAAFHHPASPGRTIGLWPRGDDPETDPAVTEVAIDDAADDGIASLDTDGLDPGDYIVALLDDGIVATSEVSLLERNARATVATTDRRYEQGDPIRVEWTGGPGNRYDWLALTRNCFDASDCPLRQWRYIDGDVNGTARFTRGSEGVWPLRPGRYAVSLCVDDDYVCVATSEVFRIVAP